MSEFPINEPPMNAVERDLAAYAPRPPRIDRDRLMFEAGRAAALDLPPAAAVRPVFPLPRWLWPSATLAMSAVAAILALALVFRPPAPQQVKIVDRYVYLPAPTQRAPELQSVASDARRLAPRPDEPTADRAPTLASLPPSHALRVRALLLTEGVDALEQPSPQVASGPASPPLSRGDFMRAMAGARNSRTPAAAGMLRWPAWLGSGSP